MARIQKYPRNIKLSRCITTIPLSNMLWKLPVAKYTISHCIAANSIHEKKTIRCVFLFSFDFSGNLSEKASAFFTSSSTCIIFAVSAVSIRFPSGSSVTVISRISANGINKEISGRLSPRSHLLTALSDIKSFYASSFCVKFFSFLLADTNLPNCSLSISNIQALLFI